MSYKEHCPDIVFTLLQIWNAVAIAEKLMQSIFNCECRNKAIVWNPWSDCISPTTCTITSPNYVVRGNGGFQKRCPRQIHLKTVVVGCHGTGGSLRLRGYNVKINMEGEMNMLLCLYNLLTVV